MTLPNLILAGAQKSASTSLFECLAAHPQCLMSRPKEPTFFSRAENLKNPAAYEACFAHHKGPVPPVVGEGSTSYMAEAYVPQRVRDLLGPEVKFVFIIRNPAERAVSAYWHQYKRGRDRRRLAEVFEGLPPSLTDACAVEEEQLARCRDRRLIDRGAYRRRYDDPLWQFRYLYNSGYDRLIERYRGLFGDERVHTVVLERLIARPVEVLAQLATFLDINPSGFPSRFDEAANATVVPRGGARLFALHRAVRSALRGAALRSVPGVKRLYRRAAFRSKPPTPPAMQASLRRLFAEETRRWSQRCGGDLAELGW